MGTTSRMAPGISATMQGDLFKASELTERNQRLIGLRLPDSKMHAAAAQVVTSLGEFLITDRTQSGCAVYIACPQPVDILPDPQRTIIFSAQANQAELGWALNHGMGAYVALSGMRGNWYDRLQKAVTSLATGHTILRKLVASAGIELDECPLNDGDVTILQCIADDMTTTEVALHMNLQEQTIKNRLLEIYRRLDVDGGRVSAIAEALRKGWID